MISLEGPTKTVRINPPRCLFFGTVFEAANRFVDCFEADLNYAAAMAGPDDPPIENYLGPDWQEIIAGYRQSLADGDGDLALRLKDEYMTQIDMVNNGERVTITGEAHLAKSRCEQAARGVIFYVVNPNLL